MRHPSEYLNYRLPNPGYLKSGLAIGREVGTISESVEHAESRSATALGIILQPIFRQLR